MPLHSHKNIDQLTEVQYLFFSFRFLPSLKPTCPGKLMVGRPYFPKLSLLGYRIFRCYVTFREGISVLSVVAFFYVALRERSMACPSCSWRLGVWGEILKLPSHRRLCAFFSLILFTMNLEYLNMLTACPFDSKSTFVAGFKVFFFCGIFLQQKNWRGFMIQIDLRHFFQMAQPSTAINPRGDKDLR